MASRFLAVLVLVFSVSILFVLLNSGGSVVKSESVFIPTEKMFPDGVKITSYEVTEFLTDEQKKALEKFDSTEFYSDILPVDYFKQSIRQYASTLIQEGVSQEEFQQKVTEYAKDNKDSTMTDAEAEAIAEDVVESAIVKTGDQTSLQLNMTATEIEKQPVLMTMGDSSGVYKRGSVIQQPIKISKLTPPPYFYNVVVTCCGMNSFKAQSGVETESDGSALIKVRTTDKFPLGDWTIEVSTLSEDNRKIWREQFHFRLVE